MKRLPEAIGVLVVLTAALGPGTGPAAGETGDGTDYGRDPRSGGSKGRLRYRIARAPYEEVETPDVLTIKDGRKLEAYFLEFYGDWLVFWAKETGTSWLREEVPRSDVIAIDFHQYLDRDPLEPPVIQKARKQPVPKDDILSGVFTGRQGRHTEWTVTFRSEIEKLRDHAEDATEYGVFEMEGRYEQRTGGQVFDHGARIRGRYTLHAPRTVNNEDWVLVLNEMVHTEVDRSPEKGWLTEAMASETFILDFSEDRSTFRLSWSNLGEWAWTPIVGVDFRRTEEEAPGKIEGSTRPEASDKAGAPVGAPPRRRARGPEDGRALLARSDEPRSVEATAVDPAPERPRRRYQVDGWKQPRTYWGSR